ncbi:Putative tartrate transporter [Paraburkholderia caffeinitolerans]|uniref:Tartrate transporter n=1 Tax=Paraburkholderia caffeinitolerans TaxID=1723730 RepID=A0A6J5GTW3_9BURK|nr:MFS transporter [Paraburkholderia caffeinitolerans]CAB3805679.1 Putative tartrate transporter [Paraburkholderia caffeinitolerans]
MPQSIITDRASDPTLAPSAVASPTSDDLLYRKVSWRVIPFLFVCYVVSFLDRINIGFAQLQMKHDLGFSDAMYGLGAAIFYVGYVLCEVPSNLLLARFGARRTFMRIMLLWGVASTCMMFVHTPTHFYALRFLLGVFEAGFFPGIVLYLTYWFPQRRRAAVFSIFFAGVAVAGVLGGLVSGWIMRDMGGVLGLEGWRWMFAIEGLPAVLLGLMAAFWLVDGPEQARWLSDAEKAHLLAQRDGATLDQPAGKHVKTSSHSFGAALRNPRVYLFAFIYFSLTCASLTLNFWMPLMIRDFGVHDLLAISLYTVIPNAVGAVGLMLIARRSDRRGERRWHFAACTIGGGVALSLLTLHLASFAAMMAILSLAAVLIFAALPIFWAVPSAYLTGKTAAAGIALISSIGITSGIVSPWAIGLIKVHTGSMDNALYVLTALLVASGVALLMGVPAAQKMR